MASLPAHQPSQQRSSPTGQSQTSPQQSPDIPVRSRPEDSQTIFVHSTDAANGDDGEAQSRDREQDFPPAATDQVGNNQAGGDDTDANKCWICYRDASETTADQGPWRDPCPCSLVAHEQCLLDWIADLEGDKNRNSRSLTQPKLECPQCKEEIKLARPRDYLVDIVRSLERVSNRAVTPGTIMALSGVLYNCSLAVGAHSIYAVFGAEDGFRILRPVIYNATRPPVEVYASSPRNASEQLLKVLIDHIVHWRIYIGLPLITPILILSRTTYADGILPVLPIVFFASQAHSPDDALDFAQWPPSASFAFALLPYARSLYNYYYQKVWAEKEKNWLKEVQPRANQAQTDGNDANLDQRQAREDQGNVFEVRIDGGLWGDEDWENEENLEEVIAANNAINDARRQRPPQQQQEDDDAAPGPEVQDNRPLPQGGANEAPRVPLEPPAQPARQGRDEHRVSFSPTAIAASVLGAICFPTIAGLTGEALKLVLPTQWTATPSVSTRFNVKAGPRGFFQQKWARSLIGGCLFVVCKDAVMLYVRWKMAQMHRNRRIVNFDRKLADRRKK